MAIGNEFSLGFGMTEEYTSGDPQFRNEYADLDVYNGTGPQRETWEVPGCLCN